jgi:hypothetical protein
LVAEPQPYAQQFFEEMCKGFENSHDKVFVIYKGTNLRAHKNNAIFQHQATQKWLSYFVPQYF